MRFADQFIPLATDVGVLSMVTYFTLTVTMFALGGAFVFFLAAEKRIAPEHRGTMILSAVIVGVAAVSYFLIRGYYHSALEAVSAAQGVAARQARVRDAYLAIGQYRYMDWLITTPLLLLKTVMVMHIGPRKAGRAITLLLLADVFMIVTGYIGTQQLNAQGDVLGSSRLFWGLVSTIGYVFIPLILLSLYRRFRDEAHPWERRAYKLLAFATVTTWGVYPLGYMVPTLLPQLSLNWVHIVFSVADVVNKVGAGVVIYIGAAKVLEDRVPQERVQEAREVA